MFETLFTCPGAVLPPPGGPACRRARRMLGHLSLETTYRYADFDLEMNAQAPKMCAVTLPDTAPRRSPSWHADSELMSFLASL